MFILAQLMLITNRHIHRCLLYNLSTKTHLIANVWLKTSKQLLKMNMYYKIPLSYSMKTIKECCRQI